MIDTAIAVAQSVLAFFAANPAVGGMAYSWLVGICITQTLKSFYPLAWITAEENVKRASLAIATISAGGFAYFWPAPGIEAWQFALLCGASCPWAYTALKLLLPNLLQNWGFSAIWQKRVDR